MQQPNWVLSILIGAIVGYLLPYIIKSVDFIVRRFHKEMAEGVWHVYHVTNREHRTQVECSTWRIRKGFNHRFVVEEQKATLGFVPYRGVLRMERGFWLVKLAGTKHEEKVMVRLLSPLPSGDSTSWGLYLGLDFEGRSVAGPVMISRNDLAADEALRKMMDRAEVHSEMKLLTA
jgi:hypothetical protein